MHTKGDKMGMKKKTNYTLLGVLVLAVFYVGYIFINSQITAARLKKEIVEQKKELKIVQENNQRLQDEVNMSKTDLFRERLARERLGLIKEGETPVIHSTTPKK